MRKSIRSQYPSMPENSLLTYIRSRSTSLVESYDNLAIQISTKESEISQLRLIYQDCTTLKSETNYNEISQQNEVRKKALEEKEKLAKMDAYYAEKAKEATEALQKQIVKEEKLRKAKASQENRKARIEQNKKRLSEIREKRKIQ